MCIHAHAYRHPCMHACMHACFYVCMYVCMYVCNSRPALTARHASRSIFAFQLEQLQSVGCSTCGHRKAHSARGKAAGYPIPPTAVQGRWWASSTAHRHGQTGETLWFLPGRGPPRRPGVHTRVPSHAGMAMPGGRPNGGPARAGQLFKVCQRKRSAISSFT